MALTYLLDPCLQHQNREGVNNVAGWFEVFLNGTDDRAQVYSDFNGTLCPEHIVIDNNGRCVMIADSSKAYRVEMYGPNGDLIYTQYPVWCMESGDGTGDSTDVISTDGTVNIVKSVSGGTTTFDLSTETEDEPSQYGERACSITDIEGGDWVELDPGDIGGTMRYNEGWFLDKDCTIDIAASVEWTSKNATALYGIDVKAVFTVDGVAVSTEYGAVDPTVDCGRTCFEWKGACKEEQYVDCHIFVKCAVDVDLPLSGRIYVNEECDGIVGSNGGASYMAGDYIQITPDHVINATGLQPVSAMSAYAYESSLSSFVQNSAFSSYSAGVHTAITSMSSDITNLSSTVSGLTGQYLEQSASSLFQPSGNYLSATDSSNFLLTSQSGMFAPSGNYVSSTDMSAYVPFSAVAGNNGQVTAIDGSAIRGHEYSGLGAVVVDNVNDTIKVNTTGLAVDADTMSAWTSGDNIVIGVKAGVYAYESSNSSKLDASAFSSVSGSFLTAVPTGYALESYVDSAVSGKLDATASSQFITSTAGLATTADVESAVSGKFDASASGELYPMTGNPSGFLTAHQSLAGLATVEYVDSAVSGKLDSSAYDSAQFQLTADMTAYQPSGNYQTAGQYLSATDSAEFILTSQSGLFQPSGDYLSSTESGKFILTSQSSQFLTGLPGDLVYSADLSAYQTTAAMTSYQAVSGMTGYIPTSESASYQQTAGMTAYQEVSAMTGYIPMSALGTGEI